VIHVGETGADRVEAFERTNERTGRKNFDFDASAGRSADGLRETNRAGVMACIFGPVGHHLELAEALRDCGRWEA
jgi:hypothetical protein